MKFNTAIFYDIENLTKGSSFTNDFIKSFSLKQIYHQINSVKIVNRIALQRAYANWSDPRLSVLKGEINELGIDPIQIFGFARYQIKNAADIQLAVDAMDVVLSREHIDVYVIVSGDGGFAALAKKLHEYGHQVIGCAYGKAANEILKSVCDHFIELEISEEELSDDGKNLHPGIHPSNSKGYGVGITHPLVVRMAKTIHPTNTTDKNKIIAQSRRIVDWFCLDTESQKEMSLKGIHLSVIREAFKYAIEGFRPENIGFGKFSEFLQFICTNTDLCVAIQPPSNILLVFRRSVPKQVETFSDLTVDELHTPERYRSLLAAGKPRITIDDKYDLQRVVNSIINHRDKSLNISELLDLLNTEAPDIESNALNGLCFSLIHCDILYGQPEDKSQSEQIFQLRTKFEDISQILTYIKDMARKKLKSVLDEDFRANVFEEIIDW